MNKELERKYYELIDSRSFHDLAVIKYEATDKHIIIEIDEEYNKGFRLILNNPKVVISRLEKNGKLSKLDFELTLNKIVDVYYHKYELYEDKPNHLIIQYCVNSDVAAIVNVDYYVDSIIAEEFIINEATEEYLPVGDIYQNNLKEIANMIDEKTYNLLSQSYFNKLFNSQIDSYILNIDLIIKFKTKMFESTFSLNFENVNIRILEKNEEITKEELDNNLKKSFDKLKQEYPNSEYIPTEYDCKIFYSGMKFKKRNNQIEASLRFTNDIEIRVLCSKITLLDYDFEISQ